MKAFCFSKQGAEMQENRRSADRSGYRWSEWCGSAAGWIVRSALHPKALFCCCFFYTTPHLYETGLKGSVLIVTCECSTCAVWQPPNGGFGRRGKLCTEAMADKKKVWVFLDISLDMFVPNHCHLLSSSSKERKPQEFSHFSKCLPEIKPEGLVT